MRGLRAGPALGGDRGALCAQARLGAAGGRVPPSTFSLAVGVSCIQCPAVRLPCLLRVGLAVFVKFSLFSAKNSSA